MQALAVTGVLTGLIFLWSFLIYEPSQIERQKAEAYALGFVVYRNAVNQYAVDHKTEGSVSLTALNLPKGLQLKNWKNRIVQEAGQLRCYVYGQASFEEIQAVLTLMMSSAAIGWNNNGVMLRNGSPHILPSFVENGNLVSVISLD